MLMQAFKLVCITESTFNLTSCFSKRIQISLHIYHLSIDDVKPKSDSEDEYYQESKTLPVACPGAWLELMFPCGIRIWAAIKFCCCLIACAVQMLSHQITFVYQTISSCLLSAPALLPVMNELRKLGCCVNLSQGIWCPTKVSWSCMQVNTQILTREPSSFSLFLWLIAVCIACCYDTALKPLLSAYGEFW